MRIVVVILCAFFCQLGQVNGQANVLFEEGRALERQYNTTEAIKKYEESIRLDPNQMTILVRLVEIHCNNIHELKEDAAKRAELDKAKSYLDKVSVLDSNSADFFYTKALYLGKLIEFSGVKEKAQFTKDIKNVLDKALLIQPEHVKALYTLAKWNEEVASLNPAVKAAMKVVFGGLPPASREEAIELHQKARKLNPGFIANNHDLAVLLKKMAKPSQAMEVLQSQMKLPTKTKEELEIKEKSKVLLQSLQ
jgi:tetratricopeptide (TPR) repeat protein